VVGKLSTAKHEVTAEYPKEYSVEMQVLGRVVSSRETDFIVKYSHGSELCVHATLRA
jgi:hypothetical protein